MRAFAIAGLAAAILFIALASDGSRGTPIVHAQTFPAPTGLTISQVSGSDDLLATWNMVAGAAQYNVRWRAQGTQQLTQPLYVSETEYTIPLSTYGTWVVRVEACNGNAVPVCGSGASKTITTVAPTATPTATATAEATATAIPTATPSPNAFVVEVRNNVTYFSWPEINKGSMATDWVIEWRYSFSSDRNELTSPDVSTPMLSGTTWTADSDKTFTWETVYWTVRHGTDARSSEVRALYVMPTPTPTPDPNATATPEPTATPIPGAVGQDGNTGQAVTLVPRIEDSRNFWMAVSVIATVFVALGLRHVNFPFPGEAALMVGICTIVIGIVKTGFSPLILLLGIGFGVALVVLLTKINR